MGEIKISAEKPDYKRQLGRSMYEWEANIKIDPK
jgi:hypothetical protein